MTSKKSLRKNEVVEVIAYVIKQRRDKEKQRGR